MLNEVPASRVLPSWNGAHGCRQRTQVWRLLAGARAERTRNMWPMSATLEVSQLSGWLNADAFCQVEKTQEERRQAGMDAGGRGGRRRKQGAGRGPDCEGCWQGHARSAHQTCVSCS